MRYLALCSLMFAGTMGSDVAAQAQAPEDYSCGYTLASGLQASWPGGYQAWTRLANVTGDTATTFEILLDVGGNTISDGYLANYDEVEGGYLVTSPSWLQWQTIPPGSDYTFAYIGQGEFMGAIPYLIRINDRVCDPLAPEIDLTVSHAFVSSDTVVTLLAEATDNVAVRKVVFYLNGQVIGEDNEAPFSLDVALSSEDNGRNLVEAKAYDPTGNEATSSEQRVFVAIDNRFLGTAPGSDEDFIDAGTYFNQITPEDAGKWGSVEATRDLMNWTGLDQAYDFAKANGFPFKLHTLVWGQQAPTWLDDLPAAEQLEELEEWMSLLAQRYSDVEMVDVVNEPLHAPPLYAEALGGSGETGWDWVVTSFAMAREYFPDAQLLINDYQILILENFVNDYLAVIQPLLERDLLDGIGVQAHFLERAELSVVAEGLATLADTGLPIYVSEFDVNIANDAHHANRIRDLFTVFWENPSVVGVTHWGHLQGDTWREDAYLIRQDGSLRPGFEWMLCYYQGGDDCTVPEYIPAGWQGNESGLLLQAEEYDEGQGIAALGDNVAYADDGDWISFKSVSFQSTWDLLSINYLKGNEEPGSISLHLNSLQADPILEVDLPSTGGWGTPNTLELPWLPMDGEYDLYVRFNGGYGVANLDSIRFHAPDEEGYGPNIIANGDFENGSTSGWFTWDGTLSATDEFAQEGDFSLNLSDRSGNGPAAYALHDLVVQGTSYQVRLFASISGAGSDQVNVTSKITCGADEEYSWLVAPITVNEYEWGEFEGVLSVPECELNELLFYVEGPQAGVDIFVDDVSVRQIQASNLMPNGGIEDGTADGWFSWDGVVRAVDLSDAAYEGSYVLSLTDRSGNGPAAYNLTPLVVAGGAYSVSLAATILGADSAAMNITQKLQCVDEEAEYSWLANSDSVSEGEWSLLSGLLQVPDCELAEVLIYLEGPPGGVELQVDDVRVIAQ